MRVTPRVALFALALACAASAPSSASPPPPDPLVAATTDALATHRAGDEGSALEKYERILTNAADAARLSPAAAAQLHTNAGAIRYGRGDAARARAHFERAVALDPTHADAVLNLALVLSEDVGAHRDALAMARDAVRLRPDHAKSHHLLGNVLQRLGQDVEAHLRFETAETLAAGSLGAVAPAGMPRRVARRAGDVETVLLEEEGDSREYSIETLSVTPPVFLVRGFLSAAERAHLVDVANRSGAMAPSRVAGPDEGSARKNADEKAKSAADSNPDPNRSRSNSMTRPARVSTTAWIPTAGDAVVEAVTRRAHALVDPTFLDAEKDKEKNAQKTRLVSERVQVLRYSRGGYFHVHHESTAFLRRFATVLYYLDGPGPGNGGHTAFPLAPDGAGGFASDATGVGYESVKRAIESRNVSEACGVGVAVEPTPGAAVLFYNFDESGRVDSSAVHAACEVTGEGAVKWAANHWYNLPEAGGANAREEGRGAGGAGTEGVDERGTSGRDELR